MGQVLFRALVGGLAGLVAWLLWEPQFPRLALDPRWGQVEVRFILTLGTFIGLAVGGLHGWIQGSRAHLLRGLLFGAVLGFAGGYFGYGIGSRLVGAFFPGDIFVGPHNPGAQMLARIVALTPMGLLIGLAIGVSGLTARRVLVGALGGLLGGFMAGFVFDPVSQLLSTALLDLRGGVDVMQNGVPVREGETGMVGRALTGLSIGLFIGLFIGIVDRVTRTAWIRLVLGKNEGKEWVVDAAQTYLGSSERAHVPLFGDPNVAPMHACIVRQGATYTLFDGGSPIGTLLNGVPVRQAPLFNGAQIQVGSHVLLFLLKHGSAPQRASEQFRSQAPGLSQGRAANPVTPMAATGISTPAPGAVAGVLSVPQAPPAQPSATFVLTALDGPLAGRRFPIREETEIGRAANGISLGHDSAASRRHAKVVPTIDGLQLQDLGSTNGTFLNGARVVSTTIRVGDVVKFGTTSFRLENA